MQEYKIYLASAAFICLTAVKLCFPTIPAQLRQEALDILCSGTDYGSAIQAMGRSLSRGQLDSELVQALEYIKSPSYGQADMIPAGDLSGTVSVYTYPSSKDSYNQTLSAGRKIVFPEQASADNTSADMPPLPFEYVSPVPVSVSSPFGYREHPVEGEYLFHYGIDLAADEGQAVLATGELCRNGRGIRQLLHTQPCRWFLQLVRPSGQSGRGEGAGAGNGTAAGSCRSDR